MIARVKGIKARLCVGIDFKLRTLFPLIKVFLPIINIKNFIYLHIN